jgi:uncharacterized protein with PIN domain
MSNTSQRDSAGAPEGMRCDFCGKQVQQVRRVALDRNYDRLQTPHVARYACPECSAEKERSRSASRAADPPR